MTDQNCILKWINRKEFLWPQVPLLWGNILRNTVCNLELEVVCTCATLPPHDLLTFGKRIEVTNIFGRGFFGCGLMCKPGKSFGFTFGNVVWNRNPNYRSSFQWFGIKLEEVFEPPSLWKGGLCWSYSDLKEPCKPYIYIYLVTIG